MLNYIAPNTSFLVWNAPKSLAAGAPPPDPAGWAYRAPPDPLAVTGWDRDLTTLSLGSANTPWTRMDRNSGQMPAWVAASYIGILYMEWPVEQWTYYICSMIIEFFKYKIIYLPGASFEGGWGRPKEKEKKERKKEKREKKRKKKKKKERRELWITSNYYI